MWRLSWRTPRPASHLVGDTVSVLSHAFVQLSWTPSLLKVDRPQLTLS
jgi:hypothetical protein